MADTQIYSLNQNFTKLFQKNSASNKHIKIMVKKEMRFIRRHQLFALRVTLKEPFI